MTMYAGDEILAADDDAFGPFSDDPWNDDSPTAIVPAYFLTSGDVFWSPSMEEYVTAVEVNERFTIAGPQVMVKDDSHEHSWHIFDANKPVEVKL